MGGGWLGGGVGGGDAHGQVRRYREAAAAQELAQDAPLEALGTPALVTAPRAPPDRVLSSPYARFGGLSGISSMNIRWGPSIVPLPSL